MYTGDMTVMHTVLASAGVRATKGRVALLSRLKRAARAQSATEIHQAVGGDLVTVYRNLAVFTKAGIIREIRLAGSAVRYEDASIRHHHHAICTGCGKIAELPACGERHIADHAGRVPGFARITHHSLEYAGICDACA